MTHCIRCDKLTEYQYCEKCFDIWWKETDIATSGPEDEWDEKLNELIVKWNKYKFKKEMTTLPRRTHSDGPRRYNIESRRTGGRQC